MKVSLLLPSYKRPKLLDIGLWSLTTTTIMYDLEILVLNDGILDNTENICNKYKNKLNIKYIFTGQRNLNKKEIFRSPSFALNIGIKQSKGDIIVLSCPEIFHLNNTIDSIITPLIDNKKLMSTPKHIYFDNTGEVTNDCHNNLQIPIDKLESNTKRCTYASKLPFLMGTYKKELIDIGGYDEDFTGFACDDDDIVDRLLLNGLSYFYADAYIVHLYHKKQYNRKNKNIDNDYLYNLKLFRERKGKIIRNENKEWGVIK